jgi:FkbM family methyltransferase
MNQTAAKSPSIGLAWTLIRHALDRTRPGAGGWQAVLYETAAQFVARYENENYEPDRNGENWLIERLAPALRTVFDVGANCGNWSREVATRAPIAKIHAFEPVPSTYEKLTEVSAVASQITVNPYGLSDSNGAVQFKVNAENSELCSLLQVPEIDRKKHWTPIEADVMRGDAYCASRSIEQIDLLKIDVEDAEWRVLDGMGRMLDGGRIGAIQFEFGFASLVLARRPLRDFWVRLESLGYRIGKLMPTVVDFRPYKLDYERRWANIVAVHQSRADMLRCLA